MFYRRTKHSYPDRELITAAALAEKLGVSNPAITKAKQAGRIDSFENSRGKEMFHEVLSAQQYLATRDRRHVTIATQGQKAVGMDNLAAQAVSHRPEFDVPRGSFGEPLPISADIQAVDLGEIWNERMDLEQSKAMKEAYMARLTKLKVDEMEGRLVPKQNAAVAVYQLAANVQDKIGNIFSFLAPEIVGIFKDRLQLNGISSEQTLAITEDLEHAVGEKIRKGCLNALKDISTKTKENILD